MPWQELTRDIPTARSELGAKDAFVLSGIESFYIVERGHVDLFAAAMDRQGGLQSRKPFIGRIEVGHAFFGATPLKCRMAGGEDFLLALMAVPALDTVLHQGERELLASRGNFNLDSVILIDNWVETISDFCVLRKSLRPRSALLLEAEPDIRYRARSTISAHHLEVLWVQADRPVHFIGRPEYEVAPGTVLPLSERLWFSLPEETRVSAQHTPAAINAETLWPALDRYNAWVLRIAEHVWVDEQNKTANQRTQDRSYKTGLRWAMVRDLSSVLGGRRQRTPLAQGHDGSPLRSAARIVAESVGVQLADSPASTDHVDWLDAAGPLVAPSGIRTRRISLSPGWERRDGPSFLGAIQDGGLRPVALVNRGPGAYEMIDPLSGDAVPVDRRRAEAMHREGVMFYPPLASHVDGGAAAVLQSLRGKGRDILQVLLMGALSALIALLTPILTGTLLADIVPRVDIPMWTASLGALLLGAAATVAVSIVGSLSMLRIEARIDETLQASVWNRLLSLPQSFFRRYLAGDLADRANSISVVRQLLTGATSLSLLNGTFSIFSFLLLFYYSWELALWAGAGTLLLAVASWFFATRQIRHQRASIAAQGQIDGLLFQMIMGRVKIRQANAELHALRRWSERYVKQKREHLSARKWAAGQLTFNALFVPLTQLAISALIWYSLIEGVADPSFSLADFLSFNAALGQFLAGATGLTATWTTVIGVLPLFERVQPILETRPESVGGTVLTDLDGRIECEHVSFRYPSGARDTVQDVSFRINPGEYVAFLGLSGSGKSTLFRLLLGFERPTAGSVLYDEHDLLSLDLSALRRCLGVVLQSGQLAPGSIASIISGDNPLTANEVWDAVRSVGLEQDIEALPMGIHTMIAERGGGLSGGQKQRLLIARALARKPRVLLLDEPTSMLDNRSQDAIRAALRNQKVTRVLVAHRLSTVIDVDYIYVMQNGRIVESGRYKDLLSQDGVMSRMARRQMI